MNNSFYMKRALRLAARARGFTSPNPMVGAVIVKRGKIIAEAFHMKAGTPHAEALAIEKAGAAANDATLYVNLEPCCHTEKRTPPCTAAITAAGIAKVVVAMQDPNPKVDGKGLGTLRSAGIQVESGTCEEEAKKLNEAYSKYITTGHPFVTLKIAMTLDGKIATPEGQSKWITGDRARSIVHRTRGAVDAIMTAIGTVKADNPRLTARRKGGRSPVRIVIDPNLEIPFDSHILKTPPETIIVTRQKPDTRIHYEKPGICFIHFKETLDLGWLMKKLGEREITSVLIEGGSSLNAHAIEDGIVDKVMFFIAPIIIGGKDSFPSVGGKSFRRLEEAWRLRDARMKKAGGDFLIEGYLHK
jgi:diaminohydroxyphosphoribosylaminopyrimidine deaminase/5-amino-6-(5-phosphoribosylamino)uracil reductase